VRNALHFLTVPLGVLALIVMVWLIPVLLVLLVLLTLALVFLLRRYEMTEPEIIVRTPPQHSQMLARLEDHDVTNQFTVLGSVKPSLFRSVTLTAILCLIDYGARHIYNRGRLGRIKTIHFARWAFLDGKKRVLFASNYDGSLEAYMDDFINKVGWGLNLVFSNGVGYPRTHWLVCDGSKSEQQFKYTLRRHQLPTQVWYKAYPGLTAFDIARNNLWGVGHSLSLRTRASTLDKRGVLTYNWPRFRDIPALNFSITGLYQDSKDVRTFAFKRQDVTLQTAELGHQSALDVLVVEIAAQSHRAIAAGVAGEITQQLQFAFAFEDATWTRESADGTLPGLQIVAAGPILQRPLPFRTPPLVRTVADADAKQVVDDLQAKGVDFIKVGDTLTRDAYFGVASEAKVDPAFPYYGSSIKKETRYILNNLKNTFEAAGSSLDQVVIRDDESQSGVKDHARSCCLGSLALPVLKTAYALDRDVHDSRRYRRQHRCEARRRSAESKKGLDRLRRGCHHLPVVATTEHHSKRKRRH
jgi:hypothetical protein